MGVVIRQSAYSSIITYVGVVIGAINTMFLFPSFLTKTEFGLMKALISMAILISPFAQAGLARSTLRYFPRFNASNKTAGRFMSLIFMIGFFTISLFILLFQLVDDWVFAFYEEKAPELIDQYWLILVLAALLVYIAIFEAYYKAKLVLVIPTLMKEFFLRIVGSLLVFALFLEWIDFQMFLHLTVASYGVSLAIMVVILLIRKELHFNFSIFQLDKPFLKELSRYMVFVMAAAIGSVIVLQVDQLMVTGFIGLDANAVYVVAFFMATVIEIPKRSIAQMSDAIIANAFEYERLDEIRKIYKQSSINQFILGCFVFLLIIFNLDNIYEIMPNGEKFVDGKWVVIIIGLGKIIDMGFGVNSEIIISSRLFKTNILFVLILAALTIILNILLIPSFGLEGAAYASALALLLYNLIKMIFIWVRFKFQPFSTSTLLALLIAALTFFSVHYIPKWENPYINVVWISGLIALIFGVLILVLKPSKEINKTILTIWNRIRP